MLSYLVSGKVLDVLGHHPSERQIQHDRRPDRHRVTAVRDIGRPCDVAHQRCDQYVVGRRLADGKDVDRVRSEHHGRLAGAGIGVREVSKTHHHITIIVWRSMRIK